jgi:hypothetical protein
MPDSQKFFDAVLCLLGCHVSFVKSPVDASQNTSRLENFVLCVISFVLCVYVVYITVNMRVDKMWIVL